MNQDDIERQLAALNEAQATISVLWAKVKSRDNLISQLEDENFRLRKECDADGRKKGRGADGV